MLCESGSILKGNHEALLLQFFGGECGSQMWRMNGDATTFRSYGVDADHCDETCRAVHWKSNRPKILMWIRQPFLDSSQDWGYTVVHGHTTVAEPNIRENRIDIDTGAAWTGRLTAMAFHGACREVIQT